MKRLGMFLSKKSSNSSNSISATTILANLRGTPIRPFIVMGILLAAASLMLIKPGRVAQAANTCTWTGATSTDWSTAGNWSSCGGLTPQSADTAIINSATNQPTINTNVTIAALTLNTGTTLTISSNTLTINGNIALNADGGASTTISNAGTLTQTAGATTSTRSNASGTANVNLSGTGTW